MATQLCEQCVQALGAFDYVAANKLAARVLKISPTLGSILSKLTNCESIFTQLSFLKPKWFFRKDNFLTSMYINLGEEIPRHLPAMEATGLIVGADSPEEHDMDLILAALKDVTKVRQGHIRIYRSMATYLLESSSTLTLDEVEALYNMTNEMGLPDRIGLLGVSIEKEMNVLYALLKARDSIVYYAFQDTCISLYECRQDLNEWKKLVQEQEFPEKSSVNSQESRSSSTWRSLFFGMADGSKGYSRGDILPHTIRWQMAYLENLTSKTTLYFNSILLAKERKIVSNDDPERSLWKGLRIDYHDQICSFRKRYSALSIAFIYEVSPDIPFHPHGYVCSDTSYESPQGVHSFPFIYYYPKPPSREHLPNIITMIQSCSPKLNDPKATPLHFFDTKLASTYYLMRVDPRVVMVIIYLDQHAHPEQAAIDFMENLVKSLRGAQVVSDLMSTD
ncbi:hypothetical protein K450DRAFT_256332 [Umbelopsis ramanniana AG]|uniref:Uncharacterized protein n=1 Tax=Umbelopsis ramanniana AG TaxID=1314678 RepID=A0AAD5HBK1_UMBRA|nr:uncharacterized protein K450DRAFT_256332 [Umbelopsis ramanniana AG]KAI8576586.1 hypothetical protein K450DRAFT_256332 [Umbelopsis ramanniana AG]